MRMIEQEAEAVTTPKKGVVVRSAWQPRILISHGLRSVAGALVPNSQVILLNIAMLRVIHPTIVMDRCSRLD
jgi:hypothetical protein